MLIAHTGSDVRSVENRGYYIPSSFTVAVNGDYYLFARGYQLRIALAIPGEDGTMDQIIFCFIRIKDRKLSFCKSLLGRCNC